MNAPSNGGSGQPPPGVSVEKMRSVLNDWRAQTLAERPDYEPRVREQVQSQFQNYTPPLYASIIGYRREWNLLVAQTRIASFAATLGRDLSNEETKAIAEHTLQNMHKNAEYKWYAVGAAGYMTYRGRNTFQFPFWKPKPNSKFNPNEANSLFSSKKVRGIYPRLMWHTMRFTAYAAVTFLFAEPIFRVINSMASESYMRRDPRLKQFNKDAQEAVNHMLGKGPRPTFSQPRDESTDGGESTSFQPQHQEEYFQGEPEAPAPTPPSSSWNTTPTPTPSQPQQHDVWSSDLDDDENASPIAASARNQPVTSFAGGSAWDRIRQQSQTGREPGESEKTYGTRRRAGYPRSTPREDQGEWDTSSSRAFSSADEEKNRAKEQAQREFDRMLEQERRVAEEGRSWGR